MTALCVFVDLHNISLLLYKSKDEFWFKNFSYVYNKSLFSASFSEDDFYLELFSTFCAEHAVKLDTCAVVITGFLEAPKLGTDTHSDFSKIVQVKYSASIFDVMKRISGVYPVLINNHSILTKETCFSSTSVRPINTHSELIDIDEENYYANLELYPQIISNEIAVQIDIDSNIASLLPKDFTLQNDLPIVFCGSRFTHKYLFSELEYLLILNFAKKSGIYDIRQDVNNGLILTTLLKMYDKNAVFDVEIPHEETLIVSKNSIDGSIATQEGTSQLVHIEKNRLLVIPSAKEERLQLKLKSHDFGSIDRTVDGGSIGIIFDTREDKKVSAQDIKNFAHGIKNFKPATL
jgi:hypothetical protein